MVEQMTEKKCKTCRWWDMHSLDMVLGTCRHEVDGVNHRYWKVPMSDGSYAMMDSFEPVDTKPNYSCGAWEYGETGEEPPEQPQPPSSPAI